MRKILLQWAGVGILALVGWGVGLMPGVTSWLPSSIMWGVAFLWLIVTIIYFIRHRVNPNDEVNKRALRETLAEFLIEGEQIKRQCRNEKVGAPEKEALDWAERVAKYLTENLGSDYKATFYNSDGLPVGITHLSGDHARIEAYMKNRLARIQQFLTELRG